ncbi:hypothetical protein BP6252_13779 [Coleophoma cylindrospora]|uniref:Uncharacterized protein n=1 Tax=Coleophoma cylindrospora TaxID=1849047 RepID=A0A3D8Q6J4_9HELO|nr:hypothetical protein BP6252_13779 [Coleophoma cylindrospora]
MEPPIWTGNEPLAPLSPTQLETYLQHVSDGELKLHAIEHSLLTTDGRLTVLKALIRFHTSKIPWGSLANHYSVQPQPSLQLTDIVEKLVVRKLGGHCLEIVPLFAAVIRSLGYDLYFTAARIGPSMAGNPGVGFHGWSHIILIVTIEGKKFVVDPQYHHITQPVLLDPQGPVVVFESVPTSIVRLRFTSLASVVPNRASSSGLMTWIFEYKHRPEDEEWMQSYIFSPESEWFCEDLQIMNVWLAKAEDSYLSSRLTIKRVLLLKEDALILNKVTAEDHVIDSTKDGDLVVPELAGSVQLVDDRLTVWRFGKLEIEQKLETEEERLMIMRKWFGIELKEDQYPILQGKLALPILDSQAK